MIYFDYSDDLIDIRYDPVFKAVFTRDTPTSQGALSKLVSALIGREVTILTLKANEPPIENFRDRQIRFDINCVTENGELINVEMSFLSEISDKKLYPRKNIIRADFIKSIGIAA